MNEILWRPGPDIGSTRLGGYLRWLESSRGLRFDDYEDLWVWSVEDVEGFWSSVWDYFEIISTSPPLGLWRA